MCWHEGMAGVWIVTQGERRFFIDSRIARSAYISILRGIQQRHRLAEIASASYRSIVEVTPPNLPTMEEAMIELAKESWQPTAQESKDELHK